VEPLNRATYTIGIASILIASLVIGAAATGLVGYGVSSSSSPKDFGLFATQNFLDLQPGASGQTVVTVVSLNGFSGPVKLSTTITPSVGGAPTVTLNPTTLKLKSGEAANSTLIVSTTKTTPTLNYTLTVVGQSGKLNHSLLVIVIVPPPDFSLTLFPNAMSLALGSSGNSMATLSSLNGFSGNITLTPLGVPLDVGVGFSPFELTLQPGGSATSTIFVNVDTSAVPGTYPMTIAAISTSGGGSLTHYATLTLTISSSPVPDFTITTSPVFLTVQQGSTGFVNVALQSIGGFNGTVSLTGSIIPAVPGGPIIILSPSVVFLGFNGTAVSTMEIITNTTTTTGFYNYTVTGTSGPLFHTAVGSLTITGVSQPDFSLFISPSSILLAPGSSQGFGVFAFSLNGFTGNVTLTSSNIPSGVTIAFPGGSPPILTVPPGGNASITAILTTSTSTLPGNYTLTISGISGSLSHAAFLHLTVSTSSGADFSISVSPTALGLPQNSNASINITFTSLAGFSGSVSVGGDILPSVPAGVTFIVSPAVVFLGSGGTAGSTMTIFTNATAAVGMYNFTVTGISGSLLHSVFGSLTVTGTVSPDFTLTASPSSLVVLQGSTGRYFLTITSIGSFAGTVSLNDSVSPAGPVLVLGVNNVSLTAGGSVIVVLSVSTNTTVPTPLGNYAITVTGMSIDHAHSVSVELAVSSPAVEGLSLESYVFNSTTAVTLYLQNIGNSTISLVSYYVRDSSGNQYALTAWPGPTINPGSVTGALILIGSSCPSCVLSGSAFTFTPGLSYAITIVTSRNNQFTFTVVR
jgi:uncharacterized membrane protein